MARDDRPGPLPAVIGGVVGAVVLFWLVGIVVSTVVFFVRIAVVIALISAALWAWATFSRE